MGRPPKKIQYLSSKPGMKTGIVFTRYIDQSGRIRRKSFSWHYNGGRSEAEAITCIEEFLKSREITVKPDIEIDTSKTMIGIADVVREKCGISYGFMVLVFEFGNSERTAHYISNANRKDMIKVLREKADVLEQGLDIMNSDKDPQ